MRRTWDLSVADRLALGFGSVGLLLVIVLASTLSWLSRIDDLRQHLGERVAPRASAAETLESAYLYKAMAARTYALTHQSKDLRAFEQHDHEATDALDRLRRLADDPAERDAVAALARLASAYDREAGRFVDIARNGEPLEALRAHEADMAATREALLVPLREYARRQAAAIVTVRQQIGDEQRKMRWALLLLGTGVLAVSAYTAWRTVEAVRRPARHLVGTARRLATGDYSAATALAKRSAPSQRDELSELGVAFGRMALSLEAREQRLASSARLAASLSGTLDAHQLCEEALREIGRHLAPELAAIYIADEDGVLHREASLAGEPGGESFAPGTGLPGEAARTHARVVARDIPPDAPFHVRFGFDRVPPRTVVATPMVARGEVVGVLVAASLRDLPEDQLLYLDQAAAQLAVSVRTAMGHLRVQELAGELHRVNEDLQSRNEELQAQQEELQCQQEELQAQREELQAQQDDLVLQNDELERAMAALMASERRFRLLFEHMGEGLALLAVEGASAREPELRFVEVNPAFATATGLPADRLLGRTLPEVDRELSEALGETAVRVARTGEPARFQLRAAASGRDLDVITFLARTAEVAVLALDITERTAIERERAEQERRRAEFLAVLSHELRNPLAPIQNSLFVLETVPPDGEDARRARAVIGRQARHLARLVDDLLDLTRISRNQVQVRRKSMDLARLVREVADDQRTVMAGRGLEFEVDAPAGPVWIEGDAIRLSQALGNLLNNAAKFTDVGRVKLALGVDPASSRATVTVKDTGIGIDPTAAARLFEPFAAASAAAKRTRGGLGLGLTLAKALVERHGGDIRVESDGEGKGTTVVVELPLCEAPAQASAPDRAISPLPRRRVLVIEDNVDAAETLREALMLTGHEVEIAHAGPDGLGKAQLFRPDVVLCDIGLPDMDGFAVARRLRADNADGRVYLVALTGYAQADDQLRATEAGFDAHLAKPASMEDINAILARAEVGGSAAVPPVDGPTNEPPARSS